MASPPLPRSSTPMIGVSIVTFLPDPDFEMSVSLLDMTKLMSSQKAAALVLTAMEKPDGERTVELLSHPIMEMWREHDGHLRWYLALIRVRRWDAAGGKGNRPPRPVRPARPTPPWVGGKIHESHQSYLLWWLPHYYSKFGWSAPTYTGMYWPSRDPAYNRKQLERKMSGVKASWGN